MTTKQKLKRMLNENTGRHMLDSGSIYGRNWERNQGVDFDKREHGCLKFDAFLDPSDMNTWEIAEMTLDLYHWLSYLVDYEPVLQKMFNYHCNRKAEREATWQDNLDSFPKYLHDRWGIIAEFTDFYNTYNHDSLLSQVIQYSMLDVTHGNDFIDESYLYVFLQIHGGYDVRGGYTKPGAFSLRSGNNLYNDEKAVIGCEDGLHDWIVFDNSELALYEYACSLDITMKGKGVIYIDENRNGYCPECGSKLNLYVF